MAPMRTNETADGDGNDPRLARLLEDIGPRMQAPKAELVAEVEAHLTDSLGVDLDEALRAVAAEQQISRMDGARL